MLKFIHLFFFFPFPPKRHCLCLVVRLFFGCEKLKFAVMENWLRLMGEKTEQIEWHGWREGGREKERRIWSEVDSFSQWIFCFRGLTTVSSADYFGSCRMEELRWWMGLSREAKSEKSLVEFHSFHPFNHYGSSPSIIVFRDSVINNLPFCVYVRQSVNDSRSCM